MKRNRSTRPFWMLSKYGGTCSKCKRGFKKGEEIFWYPAERTALCAGQECGRQAERDLKADEDDQRMYESQYGGYQ